jgi:hypothetical protein
MPAGCFPQDLGATFWVWHPQYTNSAGDALMSLFWRESFPSFGREFLPFPLCMSSQCKFGTPVVLGERYIFSSFFGHHLRANTTKICNSTQEENVNLRWEKLIPNFTENGQK